MQEALRKAAAEAAKKDPRNSIAQNVFGSADQIHSEHRHRAREAERLNLGRQFEQLGRDWFRLKSEPAFARRTRYDESSLKHDWQEAIVGLRKFPQIDQQDILHKFCMGMQLTEENPHRIYTSIIAELTVIWHKIETLRVLKGKKSVNFSPVSRMVVEVFKDISGYSDEQKTALDDFLISDIGPQKGQVMLPAALVAVSNWLRRPQPS